MGQINSDLKMSKYFEKNFQMLVRKSKTLQI
jgi:hypothetical protein